MSTHATGNTTNATPVTPAAATLPADLTVVHELDHAIELRYRQHTLLRYVYRSDIAVNEAPKPYIHPMNTLAGLPVTGYRPHDHRWHHGLAMTMANLSDNNFWGGPTFVRDQGYQWLDNHGRQVHETWHELQVAQMPLTWSHQVAWVSHEGDRWIDEHRTLRLAAFDADAGAYMLTWHMKLTNVRGEALAFGSPTTEGRPMAGYGSLFWRGPRCFTGGTIRAAGGLEGPDVMGQSAPWLAYTSPQDGSDARTTFVLADHPDNPRYPNKWFVRNTPYTCASTSFMFDEAYELAPGDTLELRYAVGVIDDAWPAERIEAWVSGF